MIYSRQHEIYSTHSNQKRDICEATCGICEAIRNIYEAKYEIIMTTRGNEAKREAQIIEAKQIDAKRTEAKCNEAT